MANTDLIRLAVLIDADNVPFRSAKEMLEEVARYGTVTIKRAYGDWTTPNLGGWKDHLHRHAIQPIQQFAYTKGKNSTDSAFIIDAMDLLYAGNVEGFCLVSSDSDFTRLATRLREAGKLVCGLGGRQTPESFVSACDRFKFLESLSAAVAQPSPAKTPANENPELRKLLTRAITACLQEGWATMGALGSFLNKHDASFSQKTYGFSKLSDLVRAQPYVEVRKSQDSTQYQVRLRR